jgi:hypothetical protein
MIHFLLPRGYEWTFANYLANRGRAVADRFRTVFYDELLGRTAIDRGTWVMVGFAALSPALLRAARELHARLSEADDVLVLNDPSRTFRRYELLDALWREGRNGFRAARADEDFRALRYPVFLRSERTHDGALSPLLGSAREVEKAIGRALVRGRTFDELLVVEFCDTADASGLYRKYSAFVVGDRILARNLEVSRQWVVKDGVREFTRPALIEEREFVVGNPHASALAEIFRVSATRYGRIDYAMKDGRVQTWEINLHPTIGPVPHPSPNAVPADLAPIAEESRQHFYREFEDAWKAIDLDASGLPPVAVALDRDGNATPSRSGPAARLVRGARRALRPLRPALEALAAPAFPLLARVARRGRAR